MEERWAVQTALALALAVLTAGCAQWMPAQDDRASLEELPGIEETDLSGATLTLEGTGCREVHMLVPANRSALAQASAPFEPAREGEARLAVALIRCESLATPNLTAENATLIEVSVPIDRSSHAPAREDALIAVLTPNPQLSRLLRGAGLPVEEVSRFAWAADRDFGFAQQATVDVQASDYPLEATFTAVSIETELPFGTAGSIGRDRWVQAGNQTLTVETGLNVTDLGGVSATIETRPGSRMAKLWGNTTRSAHGFEARYDVRMGLLPAQR